MFKCFIIFLSLFLASVSFANTDRPPQFVLLSFDGSKSPQMWKQTTSFAKNENIRFTYFISGVYFTTDANRGQYDSPASRPGASGIGFGGRAAEVKNRTAWVEFAMNQGHEIASHANGHYDGAGWSYGGWLSEFNQFDSLMLNSANYGGVKNVRSWKNYFSNELIGFRAPLLANNTNMFTALKNKKFVYDASLVRNMNYWPEKNNGIWNFPLASLRMAYSGKSTLSMDYNLYVAQSGGKKGSKANYNRWENEVYETYLKYFKNNYTGNRAPIDIGHHFSLWNGGIYWRAMQRFAQTVCNLPEVVCGTYKELVGFLESKSNSQINAYRRGAFPKTGIQYLPPVFANVSLKDERPFTETELLELQKTRNIPEEAHLDDGVLVDIVPDGIYL